MSPSTASPRLTPELAPLQPLVDAAHLRVRPAHPLPPIHLAELCTRVQRQWLDRLSPAEAWELLEAGLMAPHPAVFFEGLRAATGLRRFLPEFEALFGVPQLSDSPEPVDVGQHQLRLLDRCAEAGQPLAVRFAALVHKFGKAGTPREIWPSHYKHEERAHAAVDAMGSRFALPPDAVAFAHLAIDEVDRLHRASDLRAGALAATLDRLDAIGQPERFEALLALCTCDYAAYEGHDLNDYPKAARWRRAWRAASELPTAGMSDEARLQAWAEAIARTLRGGSQDGP